VKQTLTIERLNGHGIGVAQNGGRVLVPGTLPGESVDVILHERAYRAPVGRILQFRRYSSHRRSIECPRFPECPGCQIRHLRPAAQEQFAIQRLYNGWKRSGAADFLEPETIEYKAAPRASGYRMRCRIRLFRTADGIIPGMQAWFPDSPPIAMHRCPDHTPELNTLLAHLSDCLSKHAAEIDLDRILELRCRLSGHGPQHVTVVTVSPTKRSQRLSPFSKSLENRLRALPVTLWQISLPTRGTAASFKPLRSLGNPLPVAFPVGKRWFSLYPNIWSPVTCGTEEDLLNGIRRCFKLTPERIVEIGCGAGLLTAFLAGAGTAVTGIDVNRFAVAAARMNTMTNQRGSVLFRTGEATHAVRRLLRTGIRWDTAVIHGMRKPFGAALFGALAAAGTYHVILISPSISPWIEDARILLESGWRMERVMIFDQIPNTAGFLTLGSLRKAV